MNQESRAESPIPEAKADEEVVPPGVHDESTARILADLAAFDVAGAPDARRIAELSRFGDRIRAVLPDLLRPAIRRERFRAPEAQQGAQLARLLLLSLFDASVRTARAADTGSSWFSSRRPAVEAQGFALECGWELLCTCVRTYAPLPPRFWTDVHGLYAHALENGWETRSAGKDGESVADLHGRLHLLGLTGSNRLEPEKIEHLIEFVREEGYRLELVRSGFAPEAGGAYAFRADRDQPARFFDELPAGERRERWWMLDMRPVLAQLRKRIASRQGVAQSAPGLLQLYGRLLREWSDPPRRRHARKPAAASEGERVELVSGFAACWQALAEATGVPAASDWGVPLDADESGLPDTTPPASLLVRNRSESGLALEGAPLTQALCSGDLALLRHGECSWQLGVVRWVNFDPASPQASCGIEFLGHAPMPALVMPVMSHPGERFLRAFSLRKGRRLVLAGRLYQPFREFIIAGEDGRTAVRAVALVLQSSRYQVFDVKTDPAGTESA